MNATIANPEVTADVYTVKGFSFEVMVIKIRESRGRSWASCVTAKVPSRSGGDEHHVRIYRKNPSKCTCLAGINGRRCWAVKLIEKIAESNGFWGR